MGLYLSFICALHSTPVTGLCAFFSALLQYFFLVTFISMTAEAINLYFKLVVVLGYKISHYVIKAVTVSWGKYDNCKWYKFVITHYYQFVYVQCYHCSLLSSVLLQSIRTMSVNTCKQSNIFSSLKFQTCIILC